ncbi:MAG: 2-hydroxyacid dehydrogenase [Methylothermaceae bacterium]|nr:2-hydroxyacid dehydrogenase [Methylothermaceae bacterium]
MKIALFSTKPFDRRFFERANGKGRHEIHFLESRLSPETVALARSYPCVCVFVNDRVDAEVISRLESGGTRFIALRCAGFNNVDLHALARAKLKLVHVPAYSPHAVAEHAAALVLGLNRHLPRAYNRVREGNFSLSGLEGFNLFGKTVGVIGTGRIGATFARIMKHGFGCRVIAFDLYINEECREMGVEYLSLHELYAVSDVISVHCPLNPKTHHLINGEAVARMKCGVMLINTSRGAVIDTLAVIEGLKSGRVGSLGIDVYEQEGDLFFEDLSDQVIQDDVFERLITFPNVLVTGHQGFFTEEALTAIAEETLDNINCLEAGGKCANEIVPERVLAG